MAENQSYLQLLNPMMMIVLSIAFSAVYYNQRALKSAMWLSIGFLLAGITIIATFFRVNFEPGLVSIAISFFYLTSVSLLCYGITVQFHKRFPFRLTLYVVFAAVMAVIWFFYFQPNAIVSLASTNFAIGFIMLSTAFCIRKFEGSNPLKIVFGLLCFTGFQMIVRIPALMWFYGPGYRMEDYTSSLFSILAVLLIAFFALSLAVTLFFALGASIVTELNAKSLQDPLSRILNRRGLMMQADTMISAHQRDGMPISLVVCDIDHFKAVNDTYGHAAGDEVIVKLAQLLDTSSRGSDVCARIGGEEFCVLLWNTGLHGAKLFSNAVRMQVRNISFEGCPPGETLTASFGVAELRKDEDYHAMFARADAALYQAKQLGRDRVCGPLSVELHAIRNADIR